VLDQWSKAIIHLGTIFVYPFSIQCAQQQQQQHLFNGPLSETTRVSQSGFTEARDSEW